MQKVSTHLVVGSSLGRGLPDVLMYHYLARRPPAPPDLPPPPLAVLPVSIGYGTYKAKAVKARLHSHDAS